MEDKIRIIDFGLSDYGEILEMQRNLFATLVEKKKIGEISGKECILIGEHPSVITTGRHADLNNILMSSAQLMNEGIKIYNIERGGDVTFHSQGQMIAYPIIDLSRHKLGVKKYVDILEETVIRLLDEYGIEGNRVEGATGVWIGTERKISAIGIKCSRYCTMHGLSLNVSNDLTGFSSINPCGFKDKGVTSISNELGCPIDVEDVKRRFLHIFLGLILSF